MVFPSTGCQTCKTRRIKCDETLPTCKKCVKAGRICTGIKTKERNLTVHVENTYASGQIKRPRGPRSSPPSKVQPPNKLIVHTPPSLDLETLAVTYYLHNHFRSPQESDKENPPLSQNFSDVVISKWIGKTGKSKTDNSRIVELGISSIALAIFSQTQKCSQAALLASRYYQELLEAARSMIRVVDVGKGDMDVDVDVCLLGVFFMGRFEDAVYSSSPSIVSSNGKGIGSWKGRGNRSGTVNGKKLNSYSHHDGALAILRMWRERIFQGEGGEATQVVKHSRRGLMRSAFLRGLQLPRWMCDGEVFGERGLELSFDGIVVRISGLRREIRMLLAKRVDLECTTDELVSRARELDREAEELDDNLRKWTADFPESWDFQSHTVPTAAMGMEDFYSDVVHSYSDLASAGIWIQYYSTRMLINSSRLKTLDLIRDYSEISIEDRRQECLSHIRDRGNDLAASIPFCLQCFNVPISRQAPITINANNGIKPYLATQIIWPLTIAANISHVGNEQKTWFRAELARLGRIIGVGVIASANSSQRKDL